MSEDKKNTKIAIILIRGRVNIGVTIKQTLDYLRLKQKNVCVVINNTKENQGTLQKIKDYATFGEIDCNFFCEMLEKRGRTYSKENQKVDCKKIANEYFENKIKLREFKEKYNLKPYFRLAPPRGGFEKGGIKTPFTKKGVLGQRKEKINILIEKML